MDSKRLEELYNEYKKLKGYADGTSEVKSEDPSIYEQLKNSITKSLEGPKFPIKTQSTPVPEDKNTRIRRENSERAQGTRPASLSDDPEHQNDYYKGGKIQKYVDGTPDVEPYDPQGNNPSGIDLSTSPIAQELADEGVRGTPVTGEPVNAEDEPVERRDEEELAEEIASAPDRKTIKPKVENKKSKEKDNEESSEDTEEDKPKERKQLAPMPIEEDPDEELEGQYKGEEQKAQDVAPKAATPDEEQNQETLSTDKASALQSLMAKLKPKYSNIDFGQAKGDIAADLQRAQNQRQQLLQGDQIAKNFNLINAGLHKAQPVSPSYFDSSKLADTAVKNIEEKIALQKNDPNSQISQGMRNFVEQKYGMKIGGNPSAADIESISKPLYNEAVAELKGATQMAISQQKYAQKVGQPAAEAGTGEIQAKAEATGGQARETEASKQKNRLELAQLKGTIAGQMFDLKKNEKVKGASVDFYKDWVHQTGRGQPLGIAARTSIFADKLPALVNQYENLNDVPDTLVTDANLAFANLISQGVPPANLQALLNKNNLPRDPGKIWTWMTANPAGANQKEMLQLLMDSSQKQKQLADAQLKDAAVPLLKSYEFKGMPEEQRAQILKRFNSNEDEYKNWDGGGQFAKAAAAPQPTGLGKKNQQSKTVVKKGYNASTNQTQFIYSDGTKEIKDGKL